MKKILFICASLTMFSSFANEDDDTIVTKENSITVAATTSPFGIGGGFNSSVKRESDDRESTSSSSIELRSVDVSSSDGTSESSRRFHIDIFGDSATKIFLNETDSSVSPFLQYQTSGLEYTYDGEQGSWRMLNGGIGAGLRLDIADGIDLSAHAGVGLGVELGKRSGFFDTSLYSQADLDIHDIVRIMVKEELRSSFDGDRESLSSASVSVRVNDRLRAGAEYQSSSNTFKTGSQQDYNSSYGGLFISGSFGGGRSK